MKELHNCNKCGASAHCISIMNYNRRGNVVTEEYQVHCIAKSCDNNQTAKYIYKGNAIRFWNISNSIKKGSRRLCH